MVELLTPMLAVLAVLVVAELFVLSRLRDGDGDGDDDGEADGGTKGTDARGSKDPATPADTAQAGTADRASEAGDGAPATARPAPAGRAAATAADGAGEGAADGEGPDPLDLTYVARVVTREDGEHVGESLCLSGDRVIVKDDEGFLAVPVANVAEAGEDLVARGVDWDRARSLGGDWAKDNHDPIEFDDEGMPRR